MPDVFWQYNILTQGTGGRALYQIRTPYGGGEVYERLRDIYDYFNYINRIKNETSTRENMKLDYLLDYEILLPPIELQKKYEKIFDKVFKYIENDIFNYETIVNKINEIINE